MEKIIGFWKPNQHYGVFSQWWKDKSQKYQFKDEYLEYVCAEQYMMAQKALLFDDTDAFDKIMDESDPSKLKAIGRTIRNFHGSTWDEHKYDIVYKGNLLKFSQNERFKSILLGTGDAILCEASPFDKIWGIGMDTEHPKFNDPDYWEGENLLGKILMQVRDELKG